MRVHTYLWTYKPDKSLALWWSCYASVVTDAWHSTGQTQDYFPPTTHETNHFSNGIAMELLISSAKFEFLSLPCSSVVLLGFPHTSMNSWFFLVWWKAESLIWASEAHILFVVVYGNFSWQKNEWPFSSAPKSWLWKWLIINSGTKLFSDS